MGIGRKSDWTFAKVPTSSRTVTSESSQISSAGWSSSASCCRSFLVMDSATFLSTGSSMMPISMAVLSSSSRFMLFRSVSGSSSLSRSTPAPRSTRDAATVRHFCEAISICAFLKIARNFLSAPSSLKLMPVASWTSAGRAASLVSLSTSFGGGTLMAPVSSRYPRWFRTAQRCQKSLSSFLCCPLQSSCCFFPESKTAS
mmetsp:Transcript_44698/g.97137  ORF Transcript_44698/g.97137 Transcript_44698/m.97137 type:complete len:200 (+) Transcript_44698:392-991(+)